MIGRAFAAGRPAAPLPRRGIDAGAAPIGVVESILQGDELLRLMTFEVRLKREPLVVLVHAHTNRAAWLRIPCWISGTSLASTMKYSPSHRMSLRFGVLKPAAAHCPFLGRSRTPSAVAFCVNAEQPGRWTWSAVRVIQHLC